CTASTAPARAGAVVATVFAGPVVTVHVAAVLTVRMAAVLAVHVAVLARPARASGRLGECQKSGGIQEPGGVER
ncbi:hypothetical protein, partial [Parafrankia sp. Ea1.12]|uniref:hypothetical protein n=1 Tax=Parafrankia sp. Ea1.12 TaxID=573499 RepID=UPI001359F68A